MWENKKGPDLDQLLQSLLVSFLFVQIYEGYFVHFFGPRGLPPVEKKVVFVIDVGSSMFGAKMKQVTRALGTFHSSSKSQQADDAGTLVPWGQRPYIPTPLDLTGLVLP